MTGILCWRDSHPLEWQVASLHGHFETKLEAASSPVYRSGPPDGIATAASVKSTF